MLSARFGNRALGAMVAAIWTALAANALAQPPRPPIHAEEIEPDAALADAQRAAKAGDFRVLAVHRYSLFFPGLSELRQAEIEARYGYVVIEGTSDHWRTPAEIELNKRAAAYAKRYNAEIIRLKAAD